MKRLTATLFIIIIFALAITSTGCSSNDNFTAKDYSSDDKKIESVNIDVQDREITVSVSHDNQFHIDYFESEKEYYDIAVMENNELSIKLIYDKEWTDFIGTKPTAEYRKIELKVPNAAFANLSITTTNEKIKLSPLAVTNSISLSSNGGNIEFEKIDAGKAITFSAKNGNIAGTILGSYDVFSIACEIKKGDCNLPLQKPDGEKTLKATCNNGDIEIEFVKE